MSLLMELENLFGFKLQGFRAYGAPLKGRARVGTIIVTISLPEKFWSEDWCIRVALNEGRNLPVSGAGSN